MTDNHDYNTPAQGERNWHAPLNENFEALDTDVEIRDEDANRGEYEPDEGAKFLATDTGVVYEGDGEEWVQRLVMAQGNSLANDAPGEFAVVHGGLDNTASGDRATVVGGRRNTAGGYNSFAAGANAHAIHDGAVVFADHTSAEIRSRSAAELRSQMPVHAPAFYTTSARAEKTDVEPVSPGQALDGVESLGIHTWRLVDADTGRHMGPMAGEFAEQFGLGDDNGSIATVDADGVALAAIQGLSAKLDDKDERIGALEEETAELRSENDRLRERLAAVETELEMTRAPAENNHRKSGEDDSGAGD